MANHNPFFNGMDIMSAGTVAALYGLSTTGQPAGRPMGLVNLPRQAFRKHTAYRLVNGKYPPIHIFDDVADQADFDALYAVQALTNPRLQHEIGDLNRVPPNSGPGEPWLQLRTGPFVHINPEGSRFSSGTHGVFYCADKMATAIAETRYHRTLLP